MATIKLTSAIIVGAIVTIAAGAAWATQASGTIGVVVARAAFADRVDLKLGIREDQERGRRDNIHVRNAEDTVMQQIIFAPNAISGWHSHPGPAVVLIKTGSLTFYSGDDEMCAGRTFVAGQALIDPGQGHVHFAHNASPTESAEVWVTYFDVPAGRSPRDDAAAPGNCPF